MCNAPSLYFALLGKRLNGRQRLRPHKQGGITVSIYKCKICGLNLSISTPIPNNLQVHYSLLPEEYWNKNFLIRGYISFQKN